jgi:hypothetical protein
VAHLSLRTENHCCHNTARCTCSQQLQRSTTALRTDSPDNMSYPMSALPSNVTQPALTSPSSLCQWLPFTVYTGPCFSHFCAFKILFCIVYFGGIQLWKMVSNVASAKALANVHKARRLWCARQNSFSQGWGAVLTATSSRSMKLQRASCHEVKQNTVSIPTSEHLLKPILPSTGKAHSRARAPANK